MTVQLNDRRERRRRLDLFDRILIEHPRMKQLHNKVLDLMDDTAAAIARHEERRAKVGNRPIKAEELWMLPVLGPSGATKSTSITTLVDRILSDPELGPGEIPILTVTVRSSSRTPKHLQAQILAAYEDPAADTILSDRDYSEARVNEAIRNIARRLNTSLVILDECHSSLIQTKGANAKAMSTLLKSIVNDGIFSLVLVGTDELSPILRHAEGHSRMLEPLDFHKFSLSTKDINYFLAFVAKFERRMVKEAVIDRPIGLTSDTVTQAQIYDMAGGVIGTVVRILRIALQRVLDENRTEIRLSDVRDAFVAWNNLSEKPAPNPFLKGGPRKETKDAMIGAEEAAGVVPAN